MYVQAIPINAQTAGKFLAATICLLERDKALDKSMSDCFTDTKPPWMWFLQHGPKAWLNDSVTDCCSVPSTIHHNTTPRNIFKVS